ncbi:MAG: BACON domain-containing protein [Paludibacteraceae bacterium]|nr:BACON domain-containing protein [Paludibacteraceae bacterium]
MKKSFLAAVCCFAVCTAILTSCNTKGFSKEEYFLGILDAESYAKNTDADKAVFEKYLTDKGFKNTGEAETFGYYGTLKWNEDENYNDVLAALWEPMKAKLSSEEVDALPLSDSFKVTVGVATGSTKANLTPKATWLFPDGSYSVHWRVTNEPMEVSKAGVEDATFTVECNRPWTATVDKDWVTFSPQSGEANEVCTIHVTVAAGEEDHAQITLKAKRVDEPYIFHIDRIK